MIFNDMRVVYFRLLRVNRGAQILQENLAPCPTLLPIVFQFHEADLSHGFSIHFRIISQIMPEPTVQTFISSKRRYVRINRRNKTVSNSKVRAVGKATVHL